MARVVAHLDLDAFFAAVEVLERPELAGLPLVVGGSPDGRGVVATASYEARAFGIRSAMSAAEARRRCPQAIFVRPNMARYSGTRRAASGRWSSARVPLAQQVGIDEGYLDLTGAVATAGEAERFLRDLQAAIRAETGPRASFGCGTSKVVAKIASDHRKPRGVTVVARRARGGVPARRCRCGRCPASARSRTSGSAAAGLALIGDLAALRRRAARARSCPAPSASSCATARAASTRGRSRCRGRAQSVSRRGDVRARRRHGRGAARDRAADGGRGRGAAGARGARARTVTLKLRYPDFAIATRSQTRARAVLRAGRDRRGWR